MGVPPLMAWAPGTKPLPLTVIEYGPTGTLVGIHRR